jgi:hypothetical protein
MKRVTVIRMAAVAAVAVSGLFAAKAASAGDVSVGIRIGEPAPPPPPPVVVQQTTVYSYDTYVVGYRRNLYDADWRLRLAQSDEIRAERDLDAARRREGEIAVALDDQEALVADLHRRVDGAGANADELRVRLAALEKRVASAREDLDAARVLRDGPGTADAEKRLRDNEAAAAATADDLRRAQDGAASRERLRAAEADRERIRTDLDVAHDAVYAAQNRLTLAHEAMCVALHDRDESLWLLYRDDLVYQRVRPEQCGFSIDLNFFGGHYPHDPEVLHGYFVHDAGYWRTRPVEIHDRVVVVDRVTEITRIREVQRVHEVQRIKEVETVESSVTVEQRRAYAERVKVERDRFEVEKVERTKAVAEGRRPQISPTERAEAKAIVIKARADAKSEVAESRADAKATRLTAAADAKATKEQAAADARATRIAARADAKTEVTEGRADAKATRETAHADARATEIQAHGDRKSEVVESRGDAKAKVAEARADKIEARADKVEAKGDAKAKVAEAQADKIDARGDARSKVAEAHGDAKSDVIRAKADARNDGRSQTRPDDRKVADRTPDKDKPATAARNEPNGDRTAHKPSAVGDGHDAQTVRDSRNNGGGNGNGKDNGGNGRNNKGNKSDPHNPNDPQYSGR